MAKFFILKQIFCNVPTKMQVKNFEEKVPGKVGECIYLTVKNTTASGALSGPQTLSLQIDVCKQNKKN